MVGLVGRLVTCVAAWRAGCLWATQTLRSRVAVSHALPAFACPSPVPTEVMAFNGAPEIANGRLAMLGFLAAVGAEVATGESIFQQLADQPAWILYSELPKGMA